MNKKIYSYHFIVAFSCIIFNLKGVAVSNIVNVGTGGQLFQSFSGLLSDTAQFRTIETSGPLSVTQTTSTLVIGFSPSKKVITTSFNEMSASITCTYSNAGPWNVLLIPSFTDTIVTSSVQSLTAAAILPSALRPPSDFYFPIPVQIDNDYFSCFIKIGANGTVSIILTLGPRYWQPGSVVTLFPCMVPWFI